jgi:APA family basic amino acid/polyamine antiporter
LKPNCETRLVGGDSKERQLGFWKCLALVVGNIVGAGVFLLPASIAPFGANNNWGWPLAIGGSLCLAFVLASLAGRITGGPYAYVREAFGAEAGFLVMWTYWTSIWTANATLGIAAVSYASSLVPALGVAPLPPVLAIGCLWLFTLINIRGAGTAGSVQVLTTVLKLLPLVAVCGVALWALGSGASAAPQAATKVSAGGIASVAALAMFSMLGFECATLPAGKVINEARTIPLSTMAGTLLAGLITLAACTAVLFLLPSLIAAKSPAPFADAIAPALGHSAGSMIALFAMISALGALNGWIFCSGEVPLTMARAGVFPEWFGKTTAVGTPVRAQVFSTVLSSLLIWANYSGSMTDAFTFIVLIATDGTLVLYGACALAALKLKQAIVAAVAGVLFTAFAFWGAGLEAGLWGFGLLLLGLPIWWLNRRSRAGSSPAAAARPPAPRG